MLGWSLNIEFAGSGTAAPETLSVPGHINRHPLKAIERIATGLWISLLPH